MKIVLAGGGTGGHIIPLITIAQKIKSLDPEAQFFYLGTKGSMEQELMQANNIKVYGIATGKLRRYASARNFFDFFKVMLGIFQCLWILLRIMPDVIFSKGGYASIPVVVVGWLYRIPILIHESDAVAGFSNTFLSKFASRVALSFPQALSQFPAEKTVVTGAPIPSQISSGNAQKAREIFQMNSDKPVIFIQGGSQGAQEINSHITSILPRLLKKYQIIHQTGENNYEDVLHAAGQQGIKAGREGYYPIANYKNELPDILALSDLVIARAGSNSIFELAASKKPCILIPLGTAARDHQRANAYVLAKNGAVLVLDPANLGSNMLGEKIDELMDNTQERQAMAQRIGEYYNPEAENLIAKGVLELGK